MKIIECQQGSVAWWEARRGIPTASCFDRILTPKTMQYASGAKTYICELIAELHQLGPVEGSNGYASPAMKNGIDTEPEARRWFEMEQGVDVQRVGFITTDDGRFGCSPDALVGEDAGLELKCPTGKIHVAWLLEGRVPDEHRAQVHGCMLVTGRPFWWFLSYCPGLPPLLVKESASPYTAKLKVMLEKFWTDFQAALALVAGTAPTLRDQLEASVAQSQGVQA